MRVIHSSLTTIWVFRHGHDQPEFLQENINWGDILEISEVTKSWLYTHTILTVRSEFPSLRGRMNEIKYWDHLDETEEETVQAYRDFLMKWLKVRVL